MQVSTLHMGVPPPYQHCQSSLQAYLLKYLSTFVASKMFVSSTSSCFSSIRGRGHTADQLGPRHVGAAYHRYCYPACIYWVKYHFLLSYYVYTLVLVSPLRVANWLSIREIAPVGKSGNPPPTNRPAFVTISHISYPQSSQKPVHSPK